MKFSLLFFSLLLFPSCRLSSHLKEGASAKEIFSQANDLKERFYYKEALATFEKLKSRYLYSKLATEADLAIANIYFQQEEWGKASRAFKVFYELHPSHPKNDQVLFKLALSYFYQLPLTADRDLNLSKKVLLHLNQFLRKFLKSSYLAEVLKYKQKVLNLLAQKKWIIAQFYLHQDKKLSALPYIIELIKDADPKSQKKYKSEEIPSPQNLVKLGQEIDPKLRFKQIKKYKIPVSNKKP